MKDRFKFRVWSKKYNKFIEDNMYPIGSDHQLIITQSGTLIKLGLGDFEDDCEDSHSWATFKNYEQDCIVMQCTGLIDKNGKLIYEGDILKGKKDMICSSHSSRMVDKVGVVEIPQNMFVASCRDIKNNCTLFCQIDWVKTKVIGNIYENKELLEDNQ